MQDATCRGVVLKLLCELNSMSSQYQRGDLVQVVCNLTECDFDRITAQLIEVKLAEAQHQYSHLFDREMIEIKITDLGVKVVSKIIEPPIPIKLE